MLLCHYGGRFRRTTVVLLKTEHKSTIRCAVRGRIDAGDAFLPLNKICAAVDRRCSGKFSRSERGSCFLESNGSPYSNYGKTQEVFQQRSNGKNSGSTPTDDKTSKEDQINIKITLKACACTDNGLIILSLNNLCSLALLDPHTFRQPRRHPSRT